MSDRVEFVNTQRKYPVKPLEKLVCSAIAAAAAEEGVADGYKVCVLFCGSKKIRRLNAAMRGIDRATDVLSFPAGEGEFDPQDKTRFLGDVAICLEKAERQAKEYGHDFRREVAYLAAHSLLHLVGYDHENEAERAVMREKEERAMKKIGLERK